MRRWLVRENNGNPWCLKINKFGGRDTVTTHNEQVFGIFFSLRKKLPYVVTGDVCPSVRCRINFGTRY